MAKLWTEEEREQKRQDTKAMNIAGRIENLAMQIYAFRDVSIDEAWRLAREFMSSVTDRTKAVYEELKVGYPPIGSKLRYMDGRIAVIESHENQAINAPISAYWEDTGATFGICWPLAECWTRVSVSVRCTCAPDDLKHERCGKMDLVHLADRDLVSPLCAVEGPVVSRDEFIEVHKAGSRRCCPDCVRCLGFL